MNISLVSVEGIAFVQSYVLSKKKRKNVRKAKNQKPKDKKKKRKE